ncbi:MAG TPA: SpoIID/LytB domain-containing protein [Syntrophales bacterium]|nr:SpoIID/LytB domain-containing protein [Syntrophales bacterium]
MPLQQPLIRVGLLDGRREIRGRLQGPARLDDGRTVAGPFHASSVGGRIHFAFPDAGAVAEGPGIGIEPLGETTTLLQGVTVGADFHWRRDRDLAYAGRMEFSLRPDGALRAVNVLPLEEYLVSVISSEMNSGAPPEFLKAHAVVSRSWLTAALRRAARRTGAAAFPRTTPPGACIRWYEREDHEGFDVCADDHCQRYRGTGDFLSGGAAAAVRATAGLFLVHNGEVCDARYSKACGGMTECFETAWDDRSVPYLQSVADAPGPFAPLRTEEEVRKWLAGRPPAYCGTSDGELLAQVLNDSDRPTTDFFRWCVTYERPRLEAILREKSGIDFGRLEAIVPLERGPSGRIRLLRIAGTKETRTVGKELEIRRWLSPTHLYSSAFVVDAERDAAGLPARFVFRGGGWGHGVGFCQIGAAAMANAGFPAERILLHYFRGAELRTLY